MLSIGRHRHGGLRPPAVAGAICIFVLATVAAIPVEPDVKVENAVPVDSSALLEAALCLLKSNPALCVRQQVGRVLGNWEDILNTKKLEILAEADKEVTAARQSRGMSEADANRGKPSTVMEQIETGLGVLAEFVSEGVDEYMSEKKKSKDGEESSKTHLHHLLKLGNGRTDEDEDYRDPLAAVEAGLVDYAGMASGSPEKALGRGKKEGDQADYGIGGSGEHSAGGGSRSVGSGGDGGGGDDGSDVSAPPGGSVEERRAGIGAASRFEDDDVGELRRRRKHKHKKKKTFMKLFILGAALKAKIELLLKILSFKLQLKFFAIALIGLIINIARFWLDFKKQPQPQKVIYYEHAQHQHHYDDHGADDFGGYWKRSLHGAQADERYDEPYLYRNPKHAPTPSHYAPQLADPHAMAYQQQRPY
ncbi:uncharacterized protein LOC131215665 [Anopheles bellator]|uniref:uncharacterized protein LOC131215665 n=1 Tax=Anopheles bellator TaxID=139047 RepID=UPI002649C25E|nr:uncharacterized protein LOC131215665 [Anopheles bellator]